MKNLKRIIAVMIVISMTVAAMIFTVSADSTTDLKDMKVYAVDGNGNREQVKLDFNSITYTYDLTVKSTAASIAIESTPADATSTAVIEKDGINTVMTPGANTTAVIVTSASGMTQRYVLNTTKVDATLDSTVEYLTKKNEGKTKKKKSDKEVKVGKDTFKISTSFKKGDIPEGFEKTEAKYDGKSYSAIKGETKELTAFYLYNDEEEGFFIYNENENTFYKMNNIQIKSRMYTVVNPDKTDEVLKNYETKKIDVIDTKIKVWVLDEEERMYLLYAMNWNGETSLYCYDDNEKCFQRYLVNNDVYSQMDAANIAYKNLQKKYNKLVDKYNILLRILCGVVVVIIILLFIIFNLALNRKAKKIKKEQIKEDGNSYDSIDEKENAKEESLDRMEQPGEETDSNDIDSELEEIIEENIEDELAESVNNIIDEDDSEIIESGEVVDLDSILENQNDEQEPELTKNEPGEEKVQEEVQESEPKTEQRQEETAEADIFSEDEDDDFEFIDLD